MIVHPHARRSLEETGDRVPTLLKRKTEKDDTLPRLPVEFAPMTLQLYTRTYLYLYIVLHMNQFIHLIILYDDKSFKDIKYWLTLPTCYYFKWKITNQWYNPIQVCCKILKKTKQQQTNQKICIITSYYLHFLFFRDLLRILNHCLCFSWWYTFPIIKLTRQGDLHNC